MSAQAAQRMGLRVVILDSDPDCPAAQVTSQLIPDNWNSPAGTCELAKQASTLTLENEWANPQNLLLARELGAVVLPSPETLSIIGDKLAQRHVFCGHGLPSPRFQALNSWDDLDSIAASWNSTVVLKSRHGGYDGYGVKIVRAPIDKRELPSSPASEWFAEEYVPFDRELAVMVSKNSAGETSVYPVVESRQTTDGHRCDVVIAPAPGLSPEQSVEAQRISLSAVDAVGGIGLFGIELFDANGKFIVNEIAPRPHNSGHYTMDGTRTSQFEQHIRAVRNLAPGPTDLLATVVVMANLLAPRDGDIDLQKSLVSVLRVDPSVHVHWYGKQSLRNGRKMGHLNLLGKDFESTLARAVGARDAFWKG